MSQRNIVFPDTARNEGRFWRNLTTKGRLTRVQVLGILLMFLMVGVALWVQISSNLSFMPGSGPLWRRLVDAFGGWAIAVLAFGVLFLFLRWRVRRALREDDPRAPHK